MAAMIDQRRDGELHRFTQAIIDVMAEAPAVRGPVGQKVFQATDEQESMNAG